MAVSERKSKAQKTATVRNLSVGSTTLKVPPFIDFR